MGGIVNYNDEDISVGIRVVMKIGIKLRSSTPVLNLN